MHRVNMSQDLPYEDLEKFAKFFILKSTQIIVESRSGEKVATSCRPKHASDLKDFYLNNKRLPGVSVEARKLLEGDILKTKLPWCVEISLHAAECDNMVVETWCFGLLPEERDLSAGIIQIHDRLATVLKSLITISRILPGYKLSRRQGPDSFVLSYRFYVNDPHVQCLGDDVKHVRVGTVPTPIGAFQLSVSHRTRLETPPRPRKSDSIILESNYFSLNQGVKYKNARRKKENYDLDKPLLPPFATNRIREGILPGLMTEHGLGRLLPKVDRETERSNNGEEMEQDVCTSTTPHSTSNGLISGCQILPLDCPFGSDEKTQWGHFFRDIHTAPQLQSEVREKDERDIAEQMEILEERNKEHEASLQQFLCQDSTYIC